MHITLEEVEKIADLARLTFTDKEKQTLIKDLNNIFGHIHKINELDEELTMNEVKPMAHVLEFENDFHEDIVKKGLDQKDVMLLAPKSKNGYIVVPKII